MSSHINSGKKTDILGVSVDAVTRAEALDTLLGFLQSASNHLLFTPNPEIVLAAQKDPAFKDILNAGDLVVPDGIGLVIASRFCAVKIKERVAGYDLVLSLFDAIKGENGTVYFFGGEPGVAEAAKKNIEAAYKGLVVSGCADGFYDDIKEREVVKDIQRLKPDILLVGNAFGKQEKWIYAHRDELPVKITAGVGGSIDGWAGRVRRAPLFMQKAGLEWLWRLMLQPSRIKRMYKLPLFLFKVIFNIT